MRRTCQVGPRLRPPRRLGRRQRADGHGGGEAEIGGGDAGGFGGGGARREADGVRISDGEAEVRVWGWGEFEEMEGDEGEERSALESEQE